MQIDKALRMLRGDIPAQHSAQTAMEHALAKWNSSLAARALQNELGRFGEGAPWESCPALVALTRSRTSAAEVLEPLVGGIVEVLGTHRLAHVPLRHQYSHGVAMLQLVQAGPAVIALLAYEEASAVSQPQSVSFSDVERHEIVLAGAADLRIADLVEETRDRGAIDCRPRRVIAGEAMHFGPDSARIQERIFGRMVVLRIARSPLRPGPSRAFSLDSGALLRRASGDREESRREMAMAVLRRMGRSDAAPLLAELALEGSEHFRWQALRECLALDSATGFAALTRCANQPQDSLAPHAGTLRAQLLETYPQFAAPRRTEPCLA